MPNQTPDDALPAAAAGGADSPWPTPETRWRETLAAALRVLDHHLANLKKRPTPEDPAQAEASADGQAVDAGPR